MVTCRWHCDWHVEGRLGKTELPKLPSSSPNCRERDNLPTLDMNQPPALSFHLNHPAIFPTPSNHYSIQHHFNILTMFPSLMPSCYCHTLRHLYGAKYRTVFAWLCAQSRISASPLFFAEIGGPVVSAKDRLLMLNLPPPPPPPQK